MAARSARFLVPGLLEKPSRSLATFCLYGRFQPADQVRKANSLSHFIARALVCGSKSPLQSLDVEGGGILDGGLELTCQACFQFDRALQLFSGALPRVFVQRDERRLGTRQSQGVGSLLRCKGSLADLGLLDGGGRHLVRCRCLHLGGAPIVQPRLDVAGRIRAAVTQTLLCPRHPEEPCSQGVDARRDAEDLIGHTDIDEALPKQSNVSGIGALLIELNPSLRDARHPELAQLGYEGLVGGRNVSTTMRLPVCEIRLGRGASGPAG